MNTKFRIFNIYTVLVGILIFLGALSSYGITLPTSLDGADRKEIVEVLGVSTSSKLLSNPYPLGGFSGLEVGFSWERVDISPITQLGSTTEEQDYLEYLKLTVGKGLYFDIDVFFHMVPYSQNNDISDYGGLVKWTFLEGKFFPYIAALQLHGNNVNISESYSNTSLGLDIIFAVTVEDISFYVGGGPIRSRARFLSGVGSDAIVDPTDPGVDGSVNLVKEKLSSEHYFAGLSLELKPVFIAIQIDQYEDTVFSSKIGLRF